MTDKLKNCPFCGGGFRVNYRGAYEHDVSDCILKGIEIRNAAEIKAWNTRKPMDRIVEQLEKCSETYCKEYGYAPDENVLYLPDAIAIVKGGAE